MRRLSFALLVVLAACGTRTPLAAPVSTAISAPAPPTVTPPHFSDVKPHGWTGRSPLGHPVHGIDASRWQGGADWAQARANGVNFAWFKATEGSDLVDPSFAANFDGAGAAGIRRGAYHFFYLCGPAERQARWFIRNVPRVRGALPPVLDMEWTPFSPTCRIRPPADKIRAEAARFSDVIARHYGQRPLIYTTPDFYEANELWRLPNEFWLRSVIAHPSDRYPGKAWTFWQYSGTGLVPGISGRVDLNAFAGSEGDWRAWLAARAG